jgi:hypothetical protein
MVEMFAMNNHQKYLSSWVIALTILAALLSGSFQAFVVPILGSDQVMMQGNTINSECVGILAGSNDASGSLEVLPSGGGVPAPLPFKSVHEPSSLLLIATGLAGILFAVRLRKT